MHPGRPFSSFLVLICQAGPVYAIRQRREPLAMLTLYLVCRSTSVVQLCFPHLRCAAINLTVGRFTIQRDLLNRGCSFASATLRLTRIVGIA